MKAYLLACLGVYGVLLGWRLTPDPAQAWLLVPVWIGTSWLYFCGSYEAALQRRRTWLEQYLLAQSSAHRLLRGGWLMALWQMLIAALLCLFLLVTLRRLHPLMWLLLLASIPLIVWLTAFLRKRLGRHVKAQAMPALARRFVVPAGVAALLLAYLAIQLLLPQPDLRGLAWAEAAATLQPAQASDIAALRLLDRSYALGEITLQWALQNTLGDYAHGGLLGLAGWSLLLITGAAFLWAYVRVLVGAGTLFDKGDAST